MTELTQKKMAWIGELGFYEMPFDSMHVAEHDRNADALFMKPVFFDQLIKPKSVFVFGRRGEGKTTLRLEVAQTLRERPSTFVFSYNPSEIVDSDNNNPLQFHEQSLIKDARSELLKRILANPQRALDSKALPRIKAFFQGLEYFDLDYREFSSQEYLSRIFTSKDHWIRFPEIDQKAVKKLQLALKKAKNIKNTVVDLESFYTLLKDFQFSTLQLLIDDTDLFSETANSPELQTEILKPFFQLFKGKKPIRQFIKSFLPMAMKPYLDGFKEERYDINWTLADLRTLVNSRLKYYSESRVNDLEMISSADEDQRFTTAEAVNFLATLTGIKSPRLTLAYAKNLFTAHIDKEGPQGKLTRTDLGNALKAMGVS